MKGSVENLSPLAVDGKIVSNAGLHTWESGEKGGERDLERAWND